MSATDRLNQIETRAYTATEGPWAPWLDQDGEEHMGGLLMVGNAEAVIPDGEVYIEGVEINPVAHVYIQEDRDFIAHARTDVPALVAALRAVLDFADYWEALPPVGGSSAEQWEFDTLRDAGKELRRDIEEALS